MQGVYCPGDVHWACLEASALGGFCCLQRMEQKKRRDVHAYQFLHAFSLLFCFDLMLLTQLAICWLFSMFQITVLYSIMQLKLSTDTNEYTYNSTVKSTV